MALIVKKLSVDVAQENIFQSIIAKQYDTDSRFLSVQLTNEGENIEVSPTSVVIINAVREDGESKAFAGTVNDDGTVTLPITYWMLELDGNVKCDISVIDSDQRKLTTTSFNISVEVAAYSGTDITEDESYDVLVSLIGEISEIQEVEAARVEAELARTEAENSRIAAENERISAETARATSEQNRVSAWANALGIKEIYINNVDENKQYVFQLQIIDGKPVLYYEEATAQ
nr:MAG TPA: BppU domain protein [Caudoviricetes sp.]